MGEIPPLRFAAVEMTVGQAAPVSIVYFLNDYKLPAAVSSRAEGHVGMTTHVFSTNEALSRESSQLNAACAIGVGISLFRCNGNGGEKFPIFLFPPTGSAAFRGRSCP